MTRISDLCDRCDKPLGDQWWLYLFHEDGREEKIKQGKVPAGRHVAVRAHARCTKGWAGRVSQRQQEMLLEGMPGGVRENPVSEIRSGGRVWSLDDLVIEKKGDRILKLLPKPI